MEFFKFLKKATDFSESVKEIESNETYELSVYLINKGTMCQSFKNT